MFPSHHFLNLFIVLSFTELEFILAVNIYRSCLCLINEIYPIPKRYN